MSGIRAATVRERTKLFRTRQPTDATGERRRSQLCFLNLAPFSFAAASRNRQIRLKGVPRVLKRGFDTRNHDMTPTSLGVPPVSEL
jgi:hypothetical protein